MAQLWPGAMLFTALLAGCGSVRQQPTQSLADVRSSILAHRNVLWRQSIATASLAAAPAVGSYVWRACVRMNIKDVTGVAANREYLLGAGLEGRPPAILIQ